MNKKAYQKPAMQVVKINSRQRLLSGSLTGTTNNANMTYGGGNSGVARSRSFNDWDDEE